MGLPSGRLPNWKSAEIPSTSSRMREMEKSIFGHQSLNDPVPSNFHFIYTFYSLYPGKNTKRKKIRNQKVKEVSKVLYHSVAGLEFGLSVLMAGQTLQIEINYYNVFICYYLQ